MKMAAGATTKRRDDKNKLLKTGEGQRSNGSYFFRWTDKDGKRKIVYAKTLEDLREKEKDIEKETLDEIKSEARYITVNELYDLWKKLKRGIKDNTFSNYKYLYENYVRHSFLGKQRVSTVKKTDVKRFYNNLIDDKGLKASSVDGIHTIIHQVFELAVDDDYIRKNPSDNVLKEIKRSQRYMNDKKKALTKDQQELFLNYLRKNTRYRHWYPIFATMIGTGMRVGEVTGLRWCDIDMDHNTIDINHTLVYYNHREEEGFKSGCYASINTPKTQESNRVIPIFDMVKEALMIEKRTQDMLEKKSVDVIDGYDDFVFLNRYGKTVRGNSLNKALVRIIRDCNDEQIYENPETELLLPYFSCHTLRHTFTTRLCEAGVNVKVIQSILGHKDITTTLNIYADVTNDMKLKDFSTINNIFDKEGFSIA